MEKNFFKRGTFTCNNFFQQPKKFRWHDPYGRQLTAGGILPYDDNGVWVICERKKSNIELSDMGGKYHFEDGDIYCTIAREFCEEMYHSVSITRKDIIELSKTNEMCYIFGYNSVPVYVALIVHIDDLEKFGVIMSPSLFLERRNEVIEQNPCVPKEYYSSQSLTYIEFDKLNSYIEGKENMLVCNRLKRIFKYSSLCEKIKKEEEINICEEKLQGIVLV